ncbi:MAG: FHA domain-containing protein [Acidobacteriota bacterium]|nr:MAG: FHA domain-containing protein [Acidobacteriota bacterium]
MKLRPYWSLRPRARSSHYILSLSEIFIGRDTCCHIQLARRGISRRHAVIRIGERGARVQDLGSTNGTLLNGRRLGEGEERLRDGDTITVSRVEIRYIDPSAHRHAVPSEQQESLATEMGTMLTTTGTLSTVISQNPALLNSSEAEAALLRVVVSQSEGARVLLHETGTTREIPLHQDETLIGRAPACAVRLTDPQASSRHASIGAHGERFVIRDLGSSNGTLVNSVVVREHLLAEGDVIRIGKAKLVFFSPAPETEEVTPADMPRRPVVLIPGFAATELWKGEEKIWPNLARVLATSEARLLRDLESVEIRNIVREIVILPGFLKIDSFGAILSFLCEDLGYEKDKDLLEFPYDWRQDNRVTARCLAESIRNWRESWLRPTEKSTIVAHNMGGLVASLFILYHGGADVVERCIFLGRPHLGSISSLRMAIAGKGFLPFGVSLGRMQTVLRSFRAFYQLLPASAAARLEDERAFLPFKENHDWLESHERPFLEDAAAVRELLDTRPVTDLVPTTCVFGYR